MAIMTVAAENRGGLKPELKRAALLQTWPCAADNSHLREAWKMVFVYQGVLSYHLR